MTTIDRTAVQKRAGINQLKKGRDKFTPRIVGTKEAWTGLSRALGCTRFFLERKEECHIYNRWEKQQCIGLMKIHEYVHPHTSENKSQKGSQGQTLCGDKETTSQWMPLSQGPTLSQKSNELVICRNYGGKEKRVKIAKQRLLSFYYMQTNT